MEAGKLRNVGNHVLSDDGEASFRLMENLKEFGSTEAADAQQWFAAYTSARHEKTVAEHMAVRDIESFLPLYRTQRLWKNGCKMSLELPLFPSYIFVRISQRERVRVLEVPGIVSIVSTGDKLAPLPDADIEALRASIPLLKCEPHPYLVIGERVRIKEGSLAGMEGVLLRKKGIVRVVLSLDLIMQSVAVEVDATNVEPVSPTVNRYKLA